MIKLKTLTVKNFMSVGNVTQALNFEGHELTFCLLYTSDAADE